MKKLSPLLLICAILFACSKNEKMFDSHVATTPSPDCSIPAPGIVGWWDGDSVSSDTAYDQLNGINGVNNATLTSGVTGNAFHFDGVDDYVEIPDNSNFDFDDEITVEAWVNPTSDTGTIMSKIDNNPGPNNTGWTLDFVSDQKVEFSIVIAGVSTTVSSADSAVPYNTWTHVAATSDGSTLKLYINGMLVDSTGSLPPVSTDYNLLMGASQTSGAKENFFNGAVDEAAVYNQSLAAPEINSIANAGAYGKCKDHDGDGIYDYEDDCPESNLKDYVVIGDACVTDVENHLLPSGCTINDLLTECGENPRNHGQYVSCVAHLTNQLKKDGFITGAEKGRIQSCAARNKK